MHNTLIVTLWNPLIRAPENWYIVSMNRVFVLPFSIVLSTLAASAFDGQGQAVTITAVTNVSGTIQQVNYSESGGPVESFLLGSNVILVFPGNVCNGVGSLGVAGNMVTYSGNAITYSTGFQTVNVTSFTNNTTKATYTQPTPAKPSAYPATTGTIKQLNYGNNGAINGFLFSVGTSTTLFVDIGERPNATLTPLLKVGASVTVTGTVDPPVACAPTGTLTEVDASTLVINGTTITLNGFHY